MEQKKKVAAEEKHIHVETTAGGREAGGGGGGGGVRRRSSGALSGTPTREDQVEDVFRVCDGTGKGVASAGRLADTLTARLTDLQPRWLVGELRHALCSGGEEVQLDLTTFRHLLFTWLHENAAHIITTTTTSTSPSPSPSPPSPPPDATSLHLHHHRQDVSPTLESHHHHYYKGLSSPPTPCRQKLLFQDDQISSQIHHHHDEYPPVQHRESSPPFESTSDCYTTNQHHLSSPPQAHHHSDSLHQPSSTPAARSTNTIQHHSQHHSDFHFLGLLSSEDTLEEWVKNSSSQPTPTPSPPPPPPPPPPSARPRHSNDDLRNTFEHHLLDPSRRSTLLPRVGGWGATCDAPSFTPLEGMTHPLSPISLPRSLFNGAAAPPPPPPRPLRFSSDDDGAPRSLSGDRGDNQQQQEQEQQVFPSYRRYQHHQSLNYTYGSLEDEGGVTAPDPGELQQEVLELSHTNKRLTGENHELTTHLTAAEENNATLREQCHSLHHALLGVQQQLEAARALEAEVEAARRQVEEEKDEREQLLSRLSHLERDNTSLTTRLQTLSEQLTSTQEELDGRTQQEEEAVRRHREEVGRLSSQLTHWKAQAETQTLAAYRLQETLQDVKKLVEVLKEEKRSLEEQLNHVKEELVAATRTESDVSGTDGAHTDMSPTTPSPHQSTSGSGGESSGVPLTAVPPTTPATFTSTNTPTAAQTPSTSSLPLHHPSPSVNTPRSIHSEIQTMGEDSGSLPFCEKTEGDGKEGRRSFSASETGDSPLASVLTSMLRWWREWEERGIPLLRAMLDKDTVALHNHVTTHYEELVRLEREMQEIRQVTHSSPGTPGLASLEEALKEGSVGSAQDSALPSSQATTPPLSKRYQRTPGSQVSQLIYMFESSSQSSSPVCSDTSERPGSVEHPSSLSRMLLQARWQRRRSSDGMRSDSTNSDDEKSAEPNLRELLETVRCEEETVRCEEKAEHSKDTYTEQSKEIYTEHSKNKCTNHPSESGSEVEGVSHEGGSDGVLGSDHIDGQEEYVFLEYGLQEEEKDQEEKGSKADILIHSYNIHDEEKQDKQKEWATDEIEIHPSTNQEEEELKEDSTITRSATVVEDDTLEPQSDPYMETSHLMKLMNEVAEQRSVITELRTQIATAEDEKERGAAILQKLLRLVLQVSSETFRWTEGVRREWLAVVLPRVGGRGEEREGAEALTPATPTHPLDDVHLTTSFSREEIEALISARRDPPACEVRPREEDRLGHVSSPESLAVELEKELTALRVHVLRSHALLHHYQSSSSSSQYGSRAEVSTPAHPPLQHTQGVEVGVECDLCGPSCVPRPCDSTATQTPASPLSTTPECEESPSAILLTSSSRRRQEEEEEEGRREEKDEVEEEEEEEDKEDKTHGRRHRAHHQQRVKWKEDLEEEEGEEEEEEEGRKNINEGTSTQEEQKLLLSVAGGAKDPSPHHLHVPHSPQRPQQQAPQQPQRPPAPRQVGALELPEHRQLRQVEVVPPAHRILRQLGVGKKEEEQQEAAAGEEEGVEIIPMTSEHSLYSPKPAYDHLDHYRSGGQARGTGETKMRRTGLSTITPQVTSGGREATRGPPRSRPRAHVDLTPLSPPPSLDNVEEEDMEEEEEEEPALPSTPESSSSLASGDMFPHPPQPTRGPPRLPRQMSMSAPEPPSAFPSSPPASSSSSSSSSKRHSLQPLPEAASSSVLPPQQEQETQQEATTEEDEKRKKVFPSLHDTVLRMAGLARGDPAFTPNENLSPQEIETKFTQLSLAFKTDRLTLRQRLDLQQRHRDTAENNHGADMDCLRRLVLEIQAECTDREVSDAISQVRRHLDVLTTSSSRLVSISEVWGAVQQEWRLARAVEVIFRHVEDVKRKYEAVKHELEELKGLLTEYHIELPVSNVSGSSGGTGGSNQATTDSPSTSRRLRALSLAVSSNKTGSEKEGRRVSVAHAKTSSSGFAGSSRSRGRRASLMPDLKPFRELQFAAISAATIAATKDSSSSSSSSSASGLSTTKEREEEGSGSAAPPSARWNSSITEEVSESGDDDGGNSSQDTTTETATGISMECRASSTLSPLSPATLSHLQAIAERNQNLDDSDDGASDDQSQSELSQASSGDYGEPAPPSFPASLWNRLGSQHWLVVAMTEVLGFGYRMYTLFRWLMDTLHEVAVWAKGGQWPYSQQQTVLGARYAFTSLLLLAAALFLLVTISSGDVTAPEPHHHGWSTLHHILHPFVSVRYLGPLPT